MKIYEVMTYPIKLTDRLILQFQSCHLQIFDILHIIIHDIWKFGNFMAHEHCKFAFHLVNYILYKINTKQTTFTDHRSWSQHHPGIELDCLRLGLSYFCVFLILSFFLVSELLGRFFEIKVCINFPFIYSLRNMYLAAIIM